MPTTLTATELPRNRGWSPIGTPQRHYRLSAAVTAGDGERYRDVLLIEGYGPTYVYAADFGGCVTCWWKLAEVDGDDAAALAALGFRISEPVPIRLHGPAA